ncbi:VTT domain-containing protein [Arthrobacter citreus]|nr:VTT domain-containing protein [Arthrobacter citreus]
MHLKDLAIDMFTSYENVAVLLSISINIVISILGIVPSVFLTAANLTVFGFWEGMGISFIGEVSGTAISFVLYRKGFRKLKDVRGFSNRKVQQLLKANSKDSFLLILFLRILPLIPMGLVTFIASIGKTSLLIFLAASTLGKIPAILIEAYSVHQVINWTGEGKLIVSIVSCIILLITWRKISTHSFSRNEYYRK